MIAAVDPLVVTLGALGAIMVSVVTAFIALRKAPPEVAKLQVELAGTVNLSQNNLIDQLQEEITRLRTDLRSEIEQRKLDAARVESLAGEVDTLRTQLDDTQADLIRVRQERDQLQTALETAQGEIVTLRGRIEELEGGNHA